MKFDFSKQPNKNFYQLGKLTQEVIDLLNLDSDEKEIIMWEDRFSYIEKHITEFASESQFIRHVNAIPEIINNPDYVGLHPKGNSIEFIKTIEKNILVAVRISNRDMLSFRSMYTISNIKLENYFKSGRIKRIKD